MKCGDTESWAIKQQPPEVPEKTLQAAYMGNSILIALSILRYIEFGFGGCLMPCPYIRKKQAGIEAGIAYFGTPWTTGIEATEFPFEAAFDNQFGHGFTTMFSHFVKELQRSSDESGITLQPCLGLDYRPRSAYIPTVFDRGHMVRRLDPVWGKERAAVLANADTHHYTNSCPLCIRSMTPRGATWKTGSFRRSGAGTARGRSLPVRSFKSPIPYIKE